jgi:L-methionine (R)-S-oxide reductase
MDNRKKTGRYQRLVGQLEELTQKPGDPLSRMATICAVLHHKMDDFFWTGFYLLSDDRLLVGPYQGPVACQELEKGKGVCWAAVRNATPVLVPDVHAYPDHIACDARSRSEITLPVFDTDGRIRAVMDVDAAKKDAFNETDSHYLKRIVTLIYKEGR